MSDPDEALPLYVLYRKPKDYPDEFVCRRHIVYPGVMTGIEQSLFARAETLDELRAKLPSHLVNIGRYADDDAAIAEVWV